MMPLMFRFLGRYLLCLALFNLAACSSMRTVDLQRAVQTSNARGVEYGRMVQVRTFDGQKVKFRVTEMTDEGIGDGEAFYRYAEMESLRVEDPNSRAAESTANWVLGILGVIALGALIANSDSVKVCSPGPCPEN
jgi:hypothetical protein